MDAPARRRVAIRAKADGRRAALRTASPERVRELLGDGSYGGPYERPQADWEAVWQAGVEEVRELLVSAWR